MKPPTEIVRDGTRHKFFAGKDKMGQSIYGYYITKDGVGLYWSKGLGISKKWTEQKVEQMTKSERLHYKKTLRELKRVRDKTGATTKSGNKPDKQTTAEISLKHESTQPEPATGVESASRKNVKTTKYRNTLTTPDYRVAKRLLNDCCTVISNCSKVKTRRLIKLLNSSEEMPWYLFNSGKPIGLYHLSKLLKLFGINSKNIRFKSGIAKGFSSEQFTDATRNIKSPPES